NNRNEVVPRGSPAGCGRPRPRATARHSAAPHTNSPSTRASAGAPTQEFKLQSAIEKIAAVPARAAMAINSAVRRSRTRIKAGAITGNNRYANHSALIDHEGAFQ